MNRKWMILLLIGGLALTTHFFSPGLSPAYAVDPPTATVDTGSLNIRSGPGVGYGVVAVAQQGDKVTLLGRNESGSWVKVRTAAKIEGWANAALLFPSVSLQTLPVLTAPVLTDTAVVTTGKANVRAGAGVEYNVVTTVGRGQVVGLLGRNQSGSWVKVNPPDGRQGWVNASLLQFNTAVSNLPVLAIPPLQDNATSTATATIDGLNVRARPDVSSAVLTTLRKNETVVMVARLSNNSWIQIKTAGNITGWAAGYLLLPRIPFSQLPAVDAPTTGGPTPPPTSGDQPVQGTATVFVRSLNVRSGPGLNYAIIGGLSYRDRVNMLGRSADNGWVKVRFSDRSTGWISSAYVYTSGYVYTLPITN